MPTQEFSSIHQLLNLEQSAINWRKWQQTATLEKVLLTVQQNLSKTELMQELPQEIHIRMQN